MDGSHQLSDEHRVVGSLLSGRPAELAGPGDQADQAALADLRLDQVIAKVARGQDEGDLITGLLGRPVRDIDTLRYRHEVFRDLEDPGLFQAAGQFAAQLRQVRGHLAQLAGMRSGHQREGWFLDAAAIYCDAVRAIAPELEARAIGSRGLTAFRDYLARYVRSAAFEALTADTAARQADLAAITYQVRVKGPRVEVSRHDGEPDYSAEIEKTFERFQPGAAVKDYRVRYRTRPGMNHVGEQILDLVARLFSDEFGALAAFCREHARLIDPAVEQLDRELQFYLAYLDYIQPLRAAGLTFCYPDLSIGSKEIFAAGTFDLALAARLTAAGQTVVTNEFRLTGRERVIVVSGPNQGGKTTFARTFGQLHHLAGTGCPVPGSAARLFVPDQVFTHFEREEDLSDLAGRLEDDLLRIQKALLAATPDSVVIMNEIFTSTTASDARFLGEKVLAKVIELDLLCVYVTFIDELASLGPAVVSMTSTITPDNPAERTFKVVRKPADGLAYALAIARRHHVTYEQLKGRLT
jgi:DNA mismatch repair protein MutS